MICDDWVTYVRQILNRGGHGYVLVCPLAVPSKKRNKIREIDAKLQKKYNTEISKDARYRRKKAGLANCAYIRWDLYAVVMMTAGDLPERDEGDRFFNLVDRPYTFRVGDMIEIKIGPARSGKKFTAYLSKQSYREIKAVLRDHAEHRRIEQVIKYYERLQGLPAFSGIITQVAELRRFLVSELRRHNVKGYRPSRLALRNVYHNPQA
ncbi:MAG: hypothetical protein NAOJABEB_02942 [Steroidobacteraceae bacterium]|jgi:hypothetical protein|nr:hypothetical protein [Steroidobacteraceae bacterium]